MIRFGRNMAGEIVHYVERQLNDDSRSERRCGSEALFQLRIDYRPLNDQVALTAHQADLQTLFGLDRLGPHHVGRLDRRELFVFSRTRATNSKRPVLERQTLHAAELGGVVRDEPESESVCMCGDKEIIG